jgi:MFS family permease
MERAGSSETIEYVESDVAQRLDRLPWSRWHWLVVLALGITWILDGLEVTLVAALGGILKGPTGLGLTDSQIGAGATFYLIGQVVGALVFGFATDRVGRKKLFYTTLLIYLIGTGLTAFSMNFFMYALFRFIAGMGIGGEYSAINSAIDELIPARVRGQVDLVINSTYWAGAMIGALGTYVVLNPNLVPAAWGWRLSFVLGGFLGLLILLFRHWVPESPRWLITHGRNREAEEIVASVEREVTADPSSLPPLDGKKQRLRIRQYTPWAEIWQCVAHQYPTRSILGFTLMVTQAFLYNAIFFTYTLILVQFYNVPAETVSVYLFPFAFGNLLGPILLGGLFDSIGRKTMITLTYAVSGVLLAVTGYLFHIGVLTAVTQTIAWSVIFFIASAAASSAYLTVSEIFPLEIRGLAIAVFYAFGTLAGAIAPTIFGAIIGSGSRTALFWAYCFAGLVMIIAAIVEAFLGVKAERQSLESIATPLSDVMWPQRLVPPDVTKPGTTG